MASANDIVEGEADDRPGYVVESCRGRNGASTREDDGEIDVFDEGVGELAGDEVACERKESTDEEEEYESVVDLTLRELKSRSNDPPLQKLLVRRDNTR